MNDETEDQNGFTNETTETSGELELRDKREEVSEQLIEHIGHIMEIRDKLLQASATLCENEERTRGISLSAEDWKFIWFSASAKIVETISSSLLHANESTEEMEIRQFLHDTIQEAAKSFQLLLISEVGQILVDMGFIEDPTAKEKSSQTGTENEDI